MTVLSFPCHSEESHQWWTTKNLKTILLFSVILRRPADRRMTKNLKNILHFFRDSSFRFASFRMTVLSLPCHSEEFAERRMTKNLKTILHFFRDSSFHFVPFRMTVLSLPCHSEEFAERRMTKNLKNHSYMFKRFFLAFGES